MEINDYKRIKWSKLKEDASDELLIGALLEIRNQMIGKIKYQHHDLFSREVDELDTVIQAMELRLKTNDSNNKGI